MIKRIAFSILGFIIIVTICSCTDELTDAQKLSRALSEAEQLKAVVETQNQELSELKKKQSEDKTAYDLLKNKYDALYAGTQEKVGEKTKLESEIQGLKNTISVLEKGISEKNATKATIESKIKQLESQLAQKQAALSTANSLKSKNGTLLYEDKQVSIYFVKNKKGSQYVSLLGDNTPYWEYESEFYVNNKTSGKIQLINTSISFNGQNYTDLSEVPSVAPKSAGNIVFTTKETLPTSGLNRISGSFNVYYENETSRVSFSDIVIN